ncbi:glucose-6-phosphate dehydrogenase [Caulobacter sp. 17J80-11]|uniref:glucose-6-phosphate dehydrogenase n=1 Tax=Caulobacter sp. 17J80-11 TaxID=2763502 RepID=UPI00165346E1|nr:glucose-6-phosphate dehydrogenase [Caulobacter sp. 17J80-11]MBC6983395.1 glucose-6-phosphate dehydrogenase [Caulobacter sp. 17J80-11]
MYIQPASSRVGTAAARDQHLVLFGAGGDLATRMLWPSLFFLDLDGLLPAGLKLTGVSREELGTEAFRNRLRAELVAHPRTQAGIGAEAAWTRFAERLDYRRLDITHASDMARLNETVAPGADLLFYMATSPSLFGPACQALQGAGLAGERSRVVLEKPIGRDLASCRAVHEAVGAVFAEHQVLRIDHYLGKETVQNLIALRFANRMFEPLWNNLSIDHVQITIAETQGVGERWPYYDEYGALRDMLQNHLLQLLCLVAMEPPSDLDPEAVRAEKVKVLKSLRPIGRAQVAEDTVRGQYAFGVVEGRAAPAYVDERGAASDTETYVAVRCEIDNWRWAGVPFFLRTGKRLGERRTEIVIQFKSVPHSIFAGEGRGDLGPNRLVIRLQPEEDISLHLMHKTPGLTRDGMRLASVPLSLSKGAGAIDRRIAYERLLLDALDGNSTLFVGRAEVERAWEWVDGVAQGWREGRVPVRPYAAGSWGPAGAHALTERSGRHWHE